MNSDICGAALLLESLAPLVLPANINNLLSEGGCVTADCSVQRAGRPKAAGVVLLQ